MLKRLRVQGFKSLVDVEVEFPRLTVLFGPNAAGKSNLIEAAQMLAAIGTSRTLTDAFEDTIRGYPLEAFTFPKGGLPELLQQPTARFALTAEVVTDAEAMEYRVGIETRPAVGSLSAYDEFLQRLHGNYRPMIEAVDGQLVSRPRHGGRPPQQGINLNYAVVSDRRLGGAQYPLVEKCRTELDDWRVYYLDPRVAMRSAQPPTQVKDIGPGGAHIAPYLHRLRIEEPKRFAAVKRTLRSLIPTVEDLSVDLDEKRGELDIQIRQDGCEYSSRIISEGTLRVLALCAIAVNPWAGRLVAFEEPENGVHPRRLESIAKLLVSLATQADRQVIVTTHSALFCSSVLHYTLGREQDVSVMSVRRDGGGTSIRPVELTHSLFADEELTKSLTSSEDAVFEGLLLRGLLDE